ncbi:MAG: energy transducer TonB [Gemmatimonadetes bacterium]|nr:energy transducer TonB [Gemmatimonadota bacterium]
MSGQWVNAGIVLAAGLFAAGCEEAEVAEPVLRFTETPVEYPVDLWDANVEGVALVRVLVNVEGVVDSVTIAEGSGNAALDSAALRGAREMEFEPARRNGEPVRVWARVPVHFSKPR